MVQVCNVLKYSCIVILKIQTPPRQAILAFWKFQFSLLGFKMVLKTPLSLKYMVPF